MIPEPCQITTIRAQLQSKDEDFICHHPLPDTSVSVFFLGFFQGRTVLWDMTLATLEYFRLTAFADIGANETASFLRPFIEINEGIEGVYAVKIGLDLVTIDETVIKKAIIMMRNYKRLTVGKIIFGNSDA